MSTIIKSLAIVAAFVCLSTAALADTRVPGADPHYEIPVIANDGTSFSAEDLTGPAVTSIINVRGMTWVTFYVSVAAVSGTVSVTADCNFGPTTGDVNYPIQSEAVASGVSTFSDYIPTKSVTTSKKWPITFPTLNKDFMQCTFTSTDGTVDLVVRGK